MSQEQRPAADEVRPARTEHFNKHWEQAYEAGQELILYAQGAGGDAEETVYQRAVSIGTLARQLSGALDDMNAEHADAVLAYSKAIKTQPGKKPADEGVYVLAPYMVTDIQALEAYAHANGLDPNGDVSVYAWALDRLKAAEGLVEPPAPGLVASACKVADWARENGAPDGDYATVFEWALKRLKAAFAEGDPARLRDLRSATGAAVPTPNQMIRFHDFAHTNGASAGTDVFEFALDRLPKPGTVTLTAPPDGMFYIPAKGGKAGEDITEFAAGGPQHFKNGTVTRAEPQIDAAFGNALAGLREWAEMHRIKGRDEVGHDWLIRMRSVLSFIDTKNIATAVTECEDATCHTFPHAAGKAGA